MTITIKDVAKYAGVSPSTVSRVISNNPKISPETANKVKKAMSVMGYHPNAVAKSLVSKITSTLGLLLPRAAEELFLNPFFAEVLRGINVSANQSSFDLLMASGRNQQEEIDAVVRMVKGRKVDGIMLLCARQDDPVIKLLRQHYFPFVIIGRAPYFPDVISIDNDNFTASYEATSYLIELGHTRIGFVSGPQDLVVSQDRINGYLKAMEENKYSIHKEWIIESPFLQEGGYRAISTVMELEMRPTALVVIDDVVSIGIIKGLYEHGYQVPRDLSLVSFNNIALAELVTPPLSTIDINIYQLGFLSTSRLIEVIRGEEVSKKNIVPHKLIKRHSSVEYHE